MIFCSVYLYIATVGVNVRICRVEVGRITVGLNRRRRYRHVEMRADEAGASLYQAGIDHRACSSRRGSLRVSAMGGFELAVGDEAAE